MDIEILREQKKRMRLSNVELARLSGVSLGTVNKILSGTTKAPQIDTIKSILTVLNLNRPGEPYGYLFLDGYGTVPGEGQVQTEASLEIEEIVKGKPRLKKEPTWNQRQILLEAVFQIQKYLHEVRRMTEVERAGSGIPSDSDLQAASGPVQVWLDPRGKNVLYPDLAVVDCSLETPGKAAAGVPCFVMEIADSANAGYTCVKKMRLYQQAGVREYWVLNEEKKRILTMYQEEGRIQFGEHSFLEQVPVRSMPGLKICLAWARICEEADFK